MKVRWTNYLVFKTNHNFPFLFSAFSLTSIYLNLEIFYCTHAVIGTAFALNMLFNIPVWIGVLLTGLSTLILLALQQYGVVYHISFISLKNYMVVIECYIWYYLYKNIMNLFCIVFGQVRKLEFLIAFLVFTIAACFMVELGYAKPDAKEVLKGLFEPELKGSGATGLAISLLGAMVMPWVLHVFFSHLIFVFF